MNANEKLSVAICFGSSPKLTGLRGCEIHATSLGLGFSNTAAWLDLYPHNLLTYGQWPIFDQEFTIVHCQGQSVCVFVNRYPGGILTYHISENGLNREVQTPISILFTYKLLTAIIYYL